MEKMQNTKESEGRRWLTAGDIAAAANSVYEWSHDDGLGVVFSPEDFREALHEREGLIQRLMNGTIDNAALMINHANSHWVSVVITRGQDGVLRAFWADSLGTSDVGFYTSFTQHLLRDHHVTAIHDLSMLEGFPIQSDTYSCGAHALINAVEITNALNKNPQISNRGLVEALRGVERSDLVESVYRISLLDRLSHSNIQDLGVEDNYKENGFLSNSDRKFNL